jgi:hypothetical protein
MLVRYGLHHDLQCRDNDDVDMDRAQDWHGTVARQDKSAAAFNMAPHAWAWNRTAEHGL